MVRKLKDAIGQELDEGDLVMVVWANGGLSEAKIVGFNTRKYQNRQTGLWEERIREARIMVPGGSRKWKDSNQIIKINKLAEVDHNGEIVLL